MGATAVSDEQFAEAVVKGLSAPPIRWEGPTTVNVYGPVNQLRWNLVMEAVLEAAREVEGAKAVKPDWTPEATKLSHCNIYPEVFKVVKEPYRKGFDDSDHEERLLICTHCGRTWWQAR